MLALVRMSHDTRGRFVLLAASVLLTLLGLELGVRALVPGVPRATGYAPVNTDLRFGRPRNARGYRDLERALAKPAGTRRLVVMGDSFAWGAGIEFEDTWGQRLERGLLRRHAERWAPEGSQPSSALFLAASAKTRWARDFAAEWYWSA